MNDKNTPSASVWPMAIFCLSVCSIISTGALACDPATSSQKDVKVTYGEGNLAVDEKKKRVNRDDYLVFSLKPDPQLGPNNLDYKTVRVTVAGKNPASNWIFKSGSFNDSDGKLVVCVPSDQADGEYEYEVIVTRVGTLDPRVIVE